MTDRNIVTQDRNLQKCGEMCVGQETVTWDMRPGQKAGFLEGQQTRITDEVIGARRLVPLFTWPFNEHATFGSFLISLKTSVS